jgi:hypothetical protein
MYRLRPASGPRAFFQASTPPPMWQAAVRTSVLHRHGRALAEGAVEQEPLAGRFGELMHHAAGADAFLQGQIGHMQRVPCRSRSERSRRSMSAISGFPKRASASAAEALISLALPTASRDTPFVVVWSNIAEGSYCREVRACGIFDSIFVKQTPSANKRVEIELSRRRSRVQDLDRTQTGH